MTGFARAHARTTDPETSLEGAAAVAYRAGSQKARLLEVYRDNYPSGITDEEAGMLAGMEGIGFWKRCSDLRNDGMIEPMRKPDGSLLTYIGSAGSPVMVCRYVPPEAH